MVVVAMAYVHEIVVIVTLHTFSKYALFETKQEMRGSVMWPNATV